MSEIKPIVLCIINGWGIAPPYVGNAVTASKLPNIKKILSQYPATVLNPVGEETNFDSEDTISAEAGCYAIGTGKKLKSIVAEINQAIKDNSFYKNEVLISALKQAEKNNSSIHLLGFISQEQEMSSLNHLYSLIKLYKKASVYLHLIIDDTGDKAIKEIQEKISRFNKVEIATICGINYGMDEYGNWNKSIALLKALEKGECSDKFNDPIKAVDFYSSKKIKNEDIKPTIIIKNSKPVGVIKNKDAIVFFNFRARGIRQLAKIFSAVSIPEFPQKKKYENLHVVSLVECGKFIPVKVAFNGEQRSEIALSDILIQNKKKLVRIGESEGYGSLTYFFDGCRYEFRNGDKKILVSSNLNPSYADNPKMSANKITSVAIKEINGKEHDLVVLNYPNLDILGASGNLDFAKSAFEAIDKEIGILNRAVLGASGALIIISSNGRCEEMINPRTEEVNKENTNNPLPFIIVNERLEGMSLNDADVAGLDLSDLKPTGSLLDALPTFLKMMDIEKPKEMRGESLI